jgi:glucokinase
MRLTAAADIGGTNTKLGLVGDDGAIVMRGTVPTPAHGEPEALVSSIANALEKWLAEHASVHGLGVSVAGFLDPARSRMIENANLPALCGFPLRDALVERVGVQCVLEVDSNAAVLAEYHHGVARGATRVLGVTVGTGLGGGVIIDGALLRHTGECAGDLGHIIIDPGGRGCTCGARGCFEAMVCASAIRERAGGRSVRQIIDAAATEDPLALSALAETGRWLGIGLASLAPLFAPEVITVGGGVAVAGDALLAPTRSSFREHAAPALRDSVKLVGSAFGGWEGLVGAACALFDAS